jgi:hypothetical protein
MMNGILKNSVVSQFENQNGHREPQRKTNLALPCYAKAHPALLDMPTRGNRRELRRPFFSVDLPVFPVVLCGQFKSDSYRMRYYQKFK